MDFTRVYNPLSGLCQTTALATEDPDNIESTPTSFFSRHDTRIRGFRPLRQCSADKLRGAHGRHGNGDDEPADLRRELLAFSRYVPRNRALLPREGRRACHACSSDAVS